MKVKKKFYTIYLLAKKWKFFIVEIKYLIISGELKASIFSEDGDLVTYDKFTDIPNDLREQLKVIRSGRGIDKKYIKSKRAWDKLIITAEEVSRYASNNSETELSIEGQIPSNDIHPRTEKTLLTIIAALLDVILGDFTSNEVIKHPSIKNKSDLIEKLAELEVPGLSKSNLEKYFPLAKKAITND